MAASTSTTSRAGVPAERLLELLLADADLLDVRGPDGSNYLLLAVPPSLLDELAAHGADAEDDECGADLEPELIEPNVAAPNAILPPRTHAGHHATVTDWRKKSRRTRCA